jgi:hypothetical protein
MMFTKSLKIKKRGENFLHSITKYLSLFNLNYPKRNVATGGQEVEFHEIKSRFLSRSKERS